MTEPAIVTKYHQELSPSSFDVTPFQKPKIGEQVVFEINVVAETSDKMKKKAVVMTNAPTWSAFQIQCDEGSAIGGEDTAPAPLYYFSVGIAFCLLTHLSSFIHSKNLQVDKIKVEQRTRFRTDFEKAEDTDGTCDGVETHVVIESPEPRDKIENLVKISEKTCMAVQTIINSTPLSTHIHLNGEKII